MHFCFCIIFYSFFCLAHPFLFVEGRIQSVKLTKLVIEFSVAKYSYHKIFIVSVFTNLCQKLKEFFCDNRK